VRGEIQRVLARQPLGQLGVTPFQGLDLEGMDLASANISSAQFVKDNLTNATFAGSNATAASFSQDTWSNTICPNGVSSTYYVSGCFTPRRYEMSLIIAPKPGSTLSKSPSHFTAEFRLANPGVSVLTGSAAQALAGDHDLRAILAGPGITTQVINCGWNKSASYFTCTFATPPLAQTGTSHNYTITVRVNQGSGFMSAMPIRQAVRVSCTSDALACRSRLICGRAGRYMSMHSGPKIDMVPIRAT